MLKKQIEEILKEYSGMDFCGKKECANYDLCLQATQAIENLIVKSRVEAKAREEAKEAFIREAPRVGLSGLVFGETLTQDIYKAMQTPYLSERHDAILALIRDARVDAIASYKKNLRLEIKLKEVQ